MLNSTTVASFNIILRELTQIIIFLFLLTSVSVTLTLIAFSTSLISLGIIKFAVKYLRRYAARMQTAMADYTSTLQESIAGIRVIKAYNAEPSANKRFADVTKRFVKSAVKHKKILTLIPAFNEEERITGVIEAAQSAGIIDKICVVNDGSVDKTGPISRDLGADVINLPENRGKGCAMQTGIDSVDEIGRAHV